MWFSKKSLELYLFISKSTVSVVAEYLSRSSRVLEKCCLLTIPVQNNTKFQRRMVRGNFRALGVKLLKSFLHRLKTEVTKEEFSHSLGEKNWLINQYRKKTVCSPKYIKTFQKNTPYYCFLIKFAVLAVRVLYWWKNHTSIDCCLVTCQVFCCPHMYCRHCARFQVFVSHTRSCTQAWFTRAYF